MTTTPRGLVEHTARLATVAFCGDCYWAASGPAVSDYAHQHAQTRRHPVRIVTTDAADLIPAEPAKTRGTP